MHIIYYSDIKNIRWIDIKNHIHIVSECERRKINDLRFEKDKCRTLVGKILLLDILKENMHWEDKILPELYYNEYKKPQIINSLNLGYFNISHSEDIVACAYARNGDIGLDVEKIVDVDVNEFKEVLTLDEYYLLKSGTNTDFFRLWTTKEAIMKAVGKGFFLDPRDIPLPSLQENYFNLIIENMNLHVYSQHLNEDYMLAIAQRVDKNIILKKINLNP